jgi:hypothetical protein
MTAGMKYVTTILLMLLGVSWAVAQQREEPKKPAAVPMVLLLNNFQIVEGLFERNGTDYVQKLGRESRSFAAEKVLFAGEDRDQVRQYLLRRSNDPNKSVTPIKGFNSQATRTYPVKLQPLLMNLCMNCHSKPDHTSGFKLLRVPEGYADPAATHKNLETTLKFVNAEDPSSSALLTKAMQAHGGQKVASFKDRQVLAAQNLEKWLHWASLPEGMPMPEVLMPWKGNTPVAPKVQLGPLPQSADPFDPLLFNRLVHGK